MIDWRLPVNIAVYCETVCSTFIEKSYTQSTTILLELIFKFRCQNCSKTIKQRPQILFNWK